MERDKWAEAQWSSACLACIRPWLDLKIKKKKKKERKKERKPGAGGLMPVILATKEGRDQEGHGSKPIQVNSS
jgi:hypothetical protein